MPSPGREAPNGAARAVTDNWWARVSFLAATLCGEAQTLETPQTPTAAPPPHHDKNTTNTHGPETLQG